VGREVQREVERRNGRDRADRHATRDRQAPFAVGREVHRDDLAGDPLRLVGGARNVLTARSTSTARP
jgi:hypothetical protein